MPHKKSSLDELLNILIEITGFYWQIGATMTILFTFLAYGTLLWAIEKNTQLISSPIFSAFAENFHWIFYSLPIMSAIFAFIFANKTYQTIIKQNHQLP